MHALNRPDPSTFPDMPRRGFLRGLATLPLIGGGVALIGQPTASAEPVTPDLLEAYKTWLDLEKRFLCWDMADDPAFAGKYRGKDQSARYHSACRILSYVGNAGSYHHGPEAGGTYDRAALVLSTVGCDWRERSYRG